MALNCLRLFVVVYKHLHTVVFDHGGEIYILHNYHNYRHMYYNVLPEAICCCLLVNNIVYKQIIIIMTSLVELRKPTLLQDFVT